MSLSVKVKGRRGKVITTKTITDCYVFIPIAIGIDLHFFTYLLKAIYSLVSSVFSFSFFLYRIANTFQLKIF